MDTTYPRSEPVLSGQVIETLDVQSKGSVRLPVEEDGKG